MVFDKKDRIMVLGSCFAAGIGERLLSEGCQVCVNPFGTLFNPVSIHNSIERLRNPLPFREEDCVQLGAGSELWCSFSHYTKFARPTKEEFLHDANEALEAAAEFYRSCNKLIITFGTAYCFRHKERGIVVSNCLKRPAAEFERFRLGVDEIAQLYSDLDKDTILTVSPIRHLADGAHGNQLSKATLLLATERIVAAAGSRSCEGGQMVCTSINPNQSDVHAAASRSSEGEQMVCPSINPNLSDGHAAASRSCEGEQMVCTSINQNLSDVHAAAHLSVSYFPAYEILLDELRDYRWYAEDGVHPAAAAKEIIFDRFINDF